MTKTVRERLEKIRAALGGSQKSMSMRLGLGETTWQGYEHHHRVPKTETLQRLFALGFSIDWLVSGEGAMRRDEAAGAPASPAPGAAPLQAPEIDIFLLAHVLSQLQEDAETRGVKVTPQVFATNAARYYKMLHGKSEEQMLEVVQSLVDGGLAQWR